MMMMIIIIIIIITLQRRGGRERPRAAVGGVALSLRIELTGIARRRKRTHHGKRDACGCGDEHKNSDQATVPAELLSQLLCIVVEHNDAFARGGLDAAHRASHDHGTDATN